MRLLRLPLLLMTACAPSASFAQSVNLPGFVVSAEITADAVSLRWHNPTSCLVIPQLLQVLRSPGRVQADFYISDACFVAHEPPPDQFYALGRLPPGPHTIQIRTCAEGVSGEVCTPAPPLQVVIAGSATTTSVPALGRTGMLLLMIFLAGIAATQQRRRWR